MRYVSVCSGIEAVTVAWEPLGWSPVLFAEIEAFPRAVLAHHYPHVQCHGDFVDLIDNPPDCDVLVAGTPCQDFSIAGLRAGLAGDRGNLTLQFIRLANAIDLARRDRGKPPVIIVWENVPGALSQDGGHAFGSILAGFVGSTATLRPYGGRWTDAGCIAGPERRATWIVKDAQYFGLAQRRERVFLVASARDGFDPAAVLFEPEGVRRHFAPRREAGERVAPTIAGCSNGGGANGPGRDVDSADSLIADVAPTISARTKGGGGLGTDFDCDGGLIAHTLKGEGFDASEDGTGRGVPLVLASGQANAETSRDVSTSLTCLHEAPIVVHAFDARQSDVIQYGDKTGPLDTDGHTIGVLAFSAKDHGADAGPISPTLRAGGFDKSHANGGVMPAVAFDLRGREGGSQFEGPHDTANIRAASGGSSRSYVAASVVRRLTPRECERLQGFPDGYTDIPWRGKNWTPDGPRYKALGNSMAVPCMRWLGERIAMAVRTAP